jgi:hypothetical protein
MPLGTVGLASIFGITGFMDFVYHPEFEILENTTFQELDLFPSSDEGRETLCWVA